MWKLVLLLIAVATASGDEGHDDEEYSPGCRSVIREQCEHDKAPDDFPGTEEELEEFCKFAVKHFGCATELLDQCNDYEDAFVEMYQESNSNIIRICDKDSLLYSAIAESLPCFKKNMMLIVAPCHGRHPSILRNFTESLSRNGINPVAETTDRPNECLADLYGMSCFASRAGSVCGDVARDVVIDVLQGFDTPFAQCLPGVKEHLPAIVRVMQLEAEKEEEVENVIKKRK